MYDYICIYTYNMYDYIYIHVNAICKYCKYTQSISGVYTSMNLGGTLQVGT